MIVTRRTLRETGLVETDYQNLTVLPDQDQAFESFAPHQRKGPLEPEGAHAPSALSAVPSGQRCGGLGAEPPSAEGRALTSLDTLVTTADFREDPNKGACGRWINVLCTSCGHQQRVLERCGDRLWCGECRKQYLKDSQRRFGPVIERLEGRLRLMTFTVRSGLDLEERIAFLQKCFRRLRQRKLWKSKVRAGIRVLEITYNKETGWHPHYHCLVEGEYIDQVVLQNTWEAICKDGSKIVDIREWKGGASAAKKELIKYAVKDHNIPIELRAVVSKAFRNRKLIQLFGAIFGTDHKPEPVPCPKCGKVAWHLEWRDGMLEDSWRIDWGEPERGPPADQALVQQEFF